MIPVLFANDDLLAVNKPEGLASIPEGDKGRDCLLALLESGGTGRLYIVHRLDKEASGVILFARNAAAHKHLNEQFRQRTVSKTYVALVHGVIAANSGTIDQPIREFGSGRMGVDRQRGKPCLTEFQVSERLAAYTLVQAYPLTGRRHQLRVHFYSLGHPIVGDRRYGDKAAQLAFPRLMLHAQEIAFPLPTGEQITVQAPVPESFWEVVDRIRET
ncbi:MAG: RluA family pseudouridine synthase [Chloroflexi bacterium]|nr:RluA family pseudouridine synthase [Chloroflexota bacterium]